MRTTKKLVIAIMAVFATAGMKMYAERGYFDAPYTRYEADEAELSEGVEIESSYLQKDIAYEASDRTCVVVNNGGSITWNNVKGDFRHMGITLRYSIAEGKNDRRVTRDVDVFINEKLDTTITLKAQWSWENIKNVDIDQNKGVKNTNFRMRFDEVRCLVDESYTGPVSIKLVAKGDGVYFDFIEVEDVPDPIPCPEGFVEYSGDGTDLNSVVGKNPKIYLPQGVYNVPGIITLNANGKELRGAGPWYTTINFTGSSGGLKSDIKAIISNFSLTTDRSSRKNSYKGINGAWKPESVIDSVFVDHFECGVWVQRADGLQIRHCRFRNNFADGVNLCKGSKNCIVEYCSFRNNCDDDMAMWTTGGYSCYNNVFQYCTAENCCRSASCALYGGYGNIWRHILVKDNYEVGIRISSGHDGAVFGDGDPNRMYDIEVIGCGTDMDVYNNPVAAVEIVQTKYYKNKEWQGDGTVKNVWLSCIDIKDSNYDAFQFRSENYGVQISDVKIDGITIENVRGDLEASTPPTAFRFLRPTLVNCTHGTYMEDNTGSIKISGVADAVFKEYGKDYWNGIMAQELLPFADCDAESGLEEAESQGIDVYTEDENIIVAGVEGYDVIVIDILGRLVTRLRATEDPLVIPVPTTGVYVVRVGDKSASVLVR